MQQLLTSQRGYIMSSRCIASSAFRFGAEQIVLLRSVLKRVSAGQSLLWKSAGVQHGSGVESLLLFLSEKLFSQLVRVRRERESTLQAAQIPVCVASAVPLRASALIKRASP